MKTALEQSHVSVTPGRTAAVEIDVTNTADVMDGVTAIVDGINPEWVRLERPVVSLFPDATDRVRLVFDIPTSCPAGDYLVVARIVSTIDDERQGVHDFWLTVEPTPGLELALRPSVVTGGKGATIAATIVNTGNAEALVTLSAEEPTRDVHCLVDPSAFRIPKDHEASVDIQLHGPRPWFGQPVPRTIQITGETDGIVVEQLATFNQKPRIPRGLLTALMLAGIVALWALIFLWVIGELRRTEDSAKDLGADFFTGPGNIPLVTIAGSFEGTMTASTTGEGVPRVTVEAFRRTSTGSVIRTTTASDVGDAASIRQGETDEELVPISSAATDEDGLFALQSLLPGTYRLRISGEGYPVVWYPDSPTPEGSALIELDPTQTIDGLDISLTGEPGRLVGQIDLPPDAGEVPLTVTATQQVDRPDGQVSDDPNVEPVIVTQETTDGSIDLEGLPTPATYTINVSGPGFETQQFDQTLAGGQSTVLNTVSLGAATGSISGTVTDVGGSPLGGVAVTARAGDIERRATTPTSGNVGQFSFVDLDTPRTYVLTFDLANFASQTVSLDLQAGEQRSGVSAALGGGLGTITGQALNPDGTPLGGAPVRVLGDGVATSTSTSTTAGAGGAPGSFTITDLPVPGNYRVTIGGPDHQPETLSAAFLGPGTQALGQVTVLPTSALLTGRVSGSSGGLGQVTVTLSDGITPRVTTSASNPAGEFAFSNAAPGTYTLTFDATNYERRVVLVEVEAGIDVTRSVTLTPTPPAP